MGVSEAHTCRLTILQPSGHSGHVGLGCPVAVDGWLPEPFLGQPFFGLWVPCLPEVNHPPFLATPSDAYRLHLLGLRCAGDPRGLVPCTPPSGHCTPGASAPASFGGPAVPLICCPQRPGMAGEAFSRGNRVPRGLNGPSSEDPTPQGQSLQPLQGSMHLPTPAHPPAPTLYSSTTAQALASGRCQTSLLLAHRMVTG